MNYKNNAIRDISQLSQELPNYSLGQLLYSFLRLTGVSKICEIKELTDEEIYTAVDKAGYLEKE